MVAVLIMIISLLFTSMAIIRKRRWDHGAAHRNAMRPFELILGKTIPYILISICPDGGRDPLCRILVRHPHAGKRRADVSGRMPLSDQQSRDRALRLHDLSHAAAGHADDLFLHRAVLHALGFVFPIENMPLVVQWLTYLDPLRYMLVIIRGIFLKGVGMTVLWPQYLALVILGVVVFAGAVGRFRKRLD